jgi:hypothetical protein
MRDDIANFFLISDNSDTIYSSLGLVVCAISFLD